MWNSFNGNDAYQVDWIRKAIYVTSSPRDVEVQHALAWSVRHQHHNFELDFVNFFFRGEDLEVLFRKILQPSPPYILCPQLPKWCSSGPGAVHWTSLPTKSPRLLNMVPLTGLLGMISWPLVARIERTCAAAYFYVSNYPAGSWSNHLTFALIVRVELLGLSMVSQTWW